MVWAFTLGRYHHQVVDDDIALRLEHTRFHVLLGLDIFIPKEDTCNR